MAKSDVPRLITAFAGAPTERLTASYHHLVAALWDSGTAREPAVAATRELVAGFDGFDDTRKGYVAILLGLLAETEHPGTDGEITDVVRHGIDTYLGTWRRTTKGQPLCLALMYLLAHFPDAREPVLAVARDLAIDTDDMSRLERALRTLDPDRPDLGRAFPSPVAWQLDDDEQDFDRAWIDALTPEQVLWHWHNDTETVLGHTGAKAYWAVCNGAPAAVVVDSVPPRDPGVPSDDIAGLLRHAEAFHCPTCRSGLVFDEGIARCGGCSNAYAINGGIVDFTAVVGDGTDRSTDFLFKLAEMPSMGFFYEAHARPNFLRLCGANWAGEVMPSDEDAYIAEHVRPVDGPVLDLAAGAGRWTSVLAKAVGPERVVALDLGLPMLTTLRGRLPEIPAVLSSGRTLPFGDSTLGAVLCWNALQAFPQDAPAAIAEVGRCLRPGGTFTILTFRNSTDPVYRYFVGRHHFPQHTTGLRLFEYDDVRTWLADAGLTVRHEWSPGTFVILTAERRD